MYAPEVTVAETPGRGSRKTVGVTRLGPATAVSWLLDIRDPAGTEHVDSSSVTGPRPVRSRVEVAPNGVVSSSVSVSVPSSRMAGIETERYKNHGHTGTVSVLLKNRFQHRKQYSIFR
jgi:hypothetical protein